MRSVLGRKGLLVFSSNIFINIFGLISLIFIKRYMGYEVVGALAFVVAYVALFSSISDLGLAVTHSKLYNDKNSDKAKCTGTFLFSKFALNLVMILVVILSILIFKPQFDSEIVTILIYLTLIKVFITNNNMFFRNFFSAKLEIAKGKLPIVIGRFLQMCTKIIIVISGFSAYYIVGAEIFAGILILFIFIYLFKGNSISIPDKKHLRMYTSFALPVMFVGIVTSLNQSLDKVMINFFIGTEMVGVYTISQSLTTIFIAISSVIAGLLLPKFTKLFSDKNESQINALSNKAVKFLSMTIVPIICISILFSDMILEILYGSDTKESIKVLQILLISVYVACLTNPYSVQFISAGYPKISLLINSVTLLINILLNSIFVPSELFGYQMLGFGVEGAALTTLISMLVRFILVYFISSRILGTLFYNSVWKHILVGILSSYIIFSIGSIFSSLYFFFFGSIFIVIFYFILLNLLNEFGKKEVLFYYDILNLSDMYSYISGELFSKK